MTPDDEKTLREVVAKSDAYPVVWGRARRRSLIAYGPALLALVDSLRSEVEALRGERDRARTALHNVDADARKEIATVFGYRDEQIARADSLAGELATLRAAYVGLREVAQPCAESESYSDSETRALAVALGSTRAQLAGKVRAAVLREAAAWCRDQSAVDERLPPEYLADGLLSLAEEAERG